MLKQEKKTLGAVVGPLVSVDNLIRDTYNGIVEANEWMSDKAQNFGVEPSTVPILYLLS